MKILGKLTVTTVIIIVVVIVDIIDGRRKQQIQFLLECKHFSVDMRAVGL